MGQNWVAWVCPFSWGYLGPHRTQCRVGRGLPPYQVVSSSMQPFGHNRHGPKTGEALPPFWRGRTGSPSNTMSLWSKPTSLPSGILMHPASWPQQIWAENWGPVPHWGRRAGSPSNTIWPGPRPTRMPSFILIRPTVLATIHQRHRRTGQTDRKTGQRSDSIGRTVLQAVAHKKSSRAIADKLRDVLTK